MKNDKKDYELLTQKLNDTNIDSMEFMGIVSYAIYSKQVFPNNKDTIIFLKAVFDFSFLDYVIKSRSLITARVTRHILTLDEKQLKLVIDRVKRYIKDNQHIVEGGNNKKKKNANEKLEVWLKGL